MCGGGWEKKSEAHMPILLSIIHKKWILQSIGMQVAGFTQVKDLDLFQRVQNTLWSENN